MNEHAKGYFERGIIKNKSQVLHRKCHMSTMSDKEKQYLATLLSYRIHYKKSSHLRENIEKGKTVHDDELVRKTLTSSDLKNLIIEYNENYNYKLNSFSQRVLFKCVDTVFVKINGVLTECHLFVVYDFTINTIITTYLNEITDCHDTLRKQQYELTHIRQIYKYGIKEK